MVIKYGVEFIYLLAVQNSQRYVLRKLM